MAQFMSPMFGGLQNLAAPQQGNVQWIVTPQEKSNYDTQFDRMNPMNGFLRGDQARNFFLQSNLPPQILGQIWELADLTSDGKMDKLEFSIAMKLIKLKLQGVTLPLTLPATMRQQSGMSISGMGVSFGSNLSNGSLMMSSPQMSNVVCHDCQSFGVAMSDHKRFYEPNLIPNFGASSISGSGNLSRKNSVSENTVASSRSSLDWAVPKQTKLKYNQVFNSNDRAKTGYLSSMQARHLMSGTGLPQATLAKVWQLSDIDNDGKLSQDEFVLAMHLCDSAKTGNLLPTVLPQNLIPPSYRTVQPAVQPMAAGQLGLLTPLTQMDQSVKAATPADSNIFTTFEDKRRDNFQKGNLELEKRRLALQEIQQKEQERLEQKEREQREKREKERLEQERKKQEELEKQLERQREAEREREEQRRKAIEQKEAAQREMERQRQLEWERIRRKELLQHKLREQELVVSLRAKTKTLDVELSSHQEKRSQLQQRVQDLEARLKEQTDQLNMMNKQRELKHTLVQKQQEQIQLFNHQLNSLLPEKQLLNEKIQFKGSTGEDKNLQMSQRDYQSRMFALQRLRTQLDETETKKSRQAADLEQLNAKLNSLRDAFSKQTLAMENLNRIQQDKLRDLQEARRQKDITLTRKSSMEETRKQQEKLVNAALLRKQEMEKKKEEEARRRKDEEEKIRRDQEELRKRALEEQRLREQEEKRQQSLKALEERKRAAEEMERKKKEVQEVKKKAAEEEEAKKAEIKRKIMEMQQERLKQKHQAPSPVSASTPAVTGNVNGASKPEQQGRGFKLVLSKDPTHLVKYRALYDFTARNPDELTIGAEDIIVVDTSQDAEPDWLAGSKNGSCGWFPANYVEKISGPVIQPPPQSAKPNRSEPPSQQSSQFSMGQTSSAFSLPQKSSDSVSSLKPPEIDQRYRAVYPWIAKKDNHLSFDKDDIVAVTEMQEMWWFGHCKGKSGWFPKSYVKKISSTTPVNPEPDPPSSSPVLKRKAPAPPSAKTYMASFAFAGTEPGDLSFNAGDVIMVTEMDGEWWTGTLKGKSGIFPANYVTAHTQKQQAPQPKQQIQPKQTLVQTQEQTKMTTLSKPEVATVIAAYEATGNEQLSLQVGQIVSVRKKNDSGWWEGELQARGKKKQIGWFPANYVKLMTAGGSSSGKATPAAEKPKALKANANVCRVMAMYDYAAQNADELTFKRGEVITVSDKADADWWKGSLGSTTGLFPSNYVQDISGNRSERSSPFLKENEYQQRVMELVSSEETYLKDLQLADEAFQRPLRERALLTEQECNTLFVNLNDLIMLSAKLARAFRVRCKMTRDNLSSIKIGDILCEQLPHLHPYVRFCSCQLNASALLQEKLDSNSEFKAFVKKCESGDLWKGLPVSSYLVKPMQRVTKYPLLIKKIIETTTKEHLDHQNLTRALEKAEELCNQVNEGVREKENSDRLEWLQTHVQLDGLNDKLVFNSKTNCLDQRKYLHCGTLYKHKSNKELIGFLFNDFLLLTTPTKPLGCPANDKIFTSKSAPQFRMYKQPIFLNEVLTRLPTDSSAEEPLFYISHIENVYTLRTDNVNERTAWMNKIKEAAEHYIATEKKKREKAYQLRTQRSSEIGRLVVTIVEGCNLVKTSNGRHHPYCEVTMGEQSHTTKTVQDTLNPKWNSTMQFFIKDLSLDVLCISVFQRYMFSPDDFLGRTEVKLVEIQREVVKATKGPITKRLLLHEVDAGEVLVKLDLLLYDKTT